MLRAVKKETATFSVVYSVGDHVEARWQGKLYGAKVPVCPLPTILHLAIRFYDAIFFFLSFSSLHFIYIHVWPWRSSVYQPLYLHLPLYMSLPVNSRGGIIPLQMMSTPFLFRLSMNDTPTNLAAGRPLPTVYE